MMKFTKIILVLLYLFVYVYSVHMTQIRTEETKWGWICTLIFIIFSIWALGSFTSQQPKNNDDN